MHALHASTSGRCCAASTTPYRPSAAAVRRVLAPIAPASSSSSSSGRGVVVARAKSLDVVADVMSSGSLFTCSPEDTVDAALEQLVAHRVTGLPVVDPTSGALVGVVSDYDLLALDTLGRVSPASPDTSLFPAADQTWQAFKEVKTLLAKSSGKKVRDVMTASPITVNPGTDLDAAAALLLRKKIHRLPVVDEQSGKLVGVLSRGNLVKAALAIRKEAAAAK